MKTVTEMTTNEKTTMIAFFCEWRLATSADNSGKIVHSITDADGEDHIVNFTEYPDIYVRENMWLAKLAMRYATRSGLLGNGWHAAIAAEFTYCRDGVSSALDTVLAFIIAAPPPPQD